MDIRNLDRAKQFMAFEALSGLKEAYEKKEREVENFYYTTGDTKFSITFRNFITRWSNYINKEYIQVW